jgi:hypothetical protein
MWPLPRAWGKELICNDIGGEQSSITARSTLLANLEYLSAVAALARHHFRSTLNKCKAWS